MDKPIVALFPGAFKPPTRAHFEIVKKASPHVNEVRVIISNQDRDGYNSFISEKIWKQYSKLLPENVKIVVSTSPSPITEIYQLVKDQSNNYLVIYGKGEQDRYNAINENHKKYPNVDVFDVGDIEEISATRLREAIKVINLKEIQKLIPEGIKVKDFLLNFQLQEITINKPFPNFPIQLNNTAEAQEVAHKLQKLGYKAEWTENPNFHQEFPFIQKEHGEYFEPIIINSNGKELEWETSKGYYPEFELIEKTLNEVFTPVNHQPTLDKAIEWGYNFLQIEKPQINFINDPNYVQQHSSFGGYNPGDKSIIVSVYNRNTADICRSTFHEILHFKQDIEGRLNLEAGQDGDPFENEANAIAGKMMRKIGRELPEIFE